MQIYPDYLHLVKQKAVLIINDESKEEFREAVNSKDSVNAINLKERL